MKAAAVHFTVEGGPTLEGRFAIPATPRGTAVLCHAYPPLGGSMSNSVIVALQRALFASDWACLRFNFRGTGRSSGSFAGGFGETDDALAALAFVRDAHPGLPTVIAGWSFGSVVAMIAAARDPSVQAYAGIALPVSPAAALELPAFPAPEALRSIPMLIVGGSEDAVARPADLQAVADRYGGVATVVAGAGHFFEGHLPELTALITDFFAPVARLS